MVVNSHPISRKERPYTASQIPAPQRNGSRFYHRRYGLRLEAMPAINPSAKILVTGGSGFLGAWIIKYLLEQGFTVRTTVRTPAKADFLRQVFADSASRLEFSYVPEIAVENAFDESLSAGDIDAVIHCASPLLVSDPKGDPDLTIKPAVQGTLGVLKSCQKSPSVKRVVITSSVSAVKSPRDVGHVYTEEDWNYDIVKVVKQYGGEAPPLAKYSASKVLAETAAWDWLKENKVEYDVVVMLPVFLFGPVLSETTSDIAGSNGVLLGIIKQSTLNSLSPEMLAFPIDFIDVRETALEHIKALMTPKASGQRILSTSYIWTLEELLDELQKNPVEGITIPAYERSGVKAPFSYSKEKNARLLGIPNRPGIETLTDLLKFAVSIGWTQ
ncbi:related to GRE2-methylglyoxal reductase (NADPH-dependent) [Serendipita indica DSM 11827]|uniref:Related to GRE2-methylglyoxal reductase (NADPH-dependent) n=1 Tax=Serendipita indica (strain DSM 11827) TaxID=1109443 RepID=G4TCB7_SERID|nr:related to GRE2-methylglyoxal reductase (NADPH-dependent) [Serendipita indica DSM 11827]